MGDSLAEIYRGAGYCTALIVEDRKAMKVIIIKVEDFDQYDLQEPRYIYKGVLL